MNLNLEKSIEVANAVGARKKECWRNAALATVILMGEYIEGWVVLDIGIAIEHAWTIRNDEIIDPTAGLFGLLDERHHFVKYFPSRRYQVCEVLRWFDTSDSLPKLTYRNATHQASSDMAWKWIEENINDRPQN